jgi:ribosomal protein S27AE
VSDEKTPPAPSNPAAPLEVTSSQERCPHCGNRTLIEPSDALRFRCGVCGKARIPVDLPGLKRSDAEVPALARASASHTAALAWTAGSAVLGGFSLFSLAALALVYSALNPGLVPILFALLIALMPAGIAAHGVRRASALRARVAPAIEDAWLQVAREVIEAEGKISDVQLAKILRIDRERAEQLLAQLAATSSVRHRIEDPAPLTFEATRVRVEDEAARDAQDLEAAEAAEAAEQHKKRTQETGA